MDYKVLVIGAPQEELDFSNERPLPRLVFLMRHFYYDSNDMLRFQTLPKFIQNQPQFSREEFLETGMRELETFYETFTRERPEFRNHFEFIMVDRRTQHCMLSNPKVPKDKKEWALAKENDLYDFTTAEFKHNLECEINKIQITFMIHYFLKPGGHFLCCQKKSGLSEKMSSTMQDYPLYLPYFKDVAGLSPDLCEIVADPDENVWFVYFDFRPNTTKPLETSMFRKSKTQLCYLDEDMVD